MTAPALPAAAVDGAPAQGLVAAADLEQWVVLPAAADVVAVAEVGFGLGDLSTGVVGVGDRDRADQGGESGQLREDAGAPAGLDDEGGQGPMIEDSNGCLGLLRRPSTGLSRSLTRGPSASR